MGIRFRYRSVAAAESGEGSRPPLGFIGSKKEEEEEERRKEKDEEYRGE